MNNPMSAETKPLPCPFRGAEMERLYLSEGWSHPRHPDHLCMMEGVTHYVAAQLAAWNRRAPPAAQAWRADAVPMPANADQAAGMEVLGMAWLRRYAPDRLTPDGRLAADALLQAIMANAAALAVLAAPPGTDPAPPAQPALVEALRDILRSAELLDVAPYGATVRDFVLSTRSCARAALAAAEAGRG